jgi:O-antigen ligase
MRLSFNTKSILAGFIFATSMMSYFNFPGAVRTVFLALNVVVLVILAGSSFKLKNFAMVFAAGYFFLIVTASLIVNSMTTSNGSFQSLLYPLVFALQLICAPTLLAKFSNSRLVLSIFLVLFCALWLGVLSDFGNNTGRMSFIPGVMASSSFALNANYFSTLMAACLIFFANRAHLSAWRSPFFWFIVILAGIGVLVGGSRGVVLGLLLTLFLYVFRRFKIAEIFLLILTIVVSIAIVESFSEDFSSLFRVYKGFNGRDEIWGSAYSVAVEHFWFGVGADTAQAFGSVGSGEAAGRSTHNGIIELSLKFGVIQSILLVAILFASAWKSPLETRSQRLAFFCTMFFFAMTMTRTYHLGGVGIIPLLAAIGFNGANLRSK